MYERRSEPLIPFSRFRRRVFLHVLAALCLLVGSILIGAIGFVVLERMDWDLAALHATTLVSGLGLAEIPKTPGAKLFASLFALYSGFVFVAMSGIIIAPVAHRMLHYFHWEGGGNPKSDK
ncbi:hypothetical protein [Chelativorans alearense]|uniref:hypothetical protein n=1 Tax=Chelativorans alearense TaxID=2681495 RepID=UPI0013D10315|nr:hypothetical protein [Chelativorans alearense]